MNRTIFLAASCAAMLVSTPLFAQDSSGASGSGLSLDSGGQGLRLAQLTTTASSGAQGGANGMVVYPAKGQSAREQDKDRYECHEWAKGQTGFDPVQPAQLATASASGTPKAGGIGPIGALRDRMQQKKAEQAGQQQAQQQQAQRGQQQARYERAVGACLEGRGYAVN